MSIDKGAMIDVAGKKEEDQEAQGSERFCQCVVLTVKKNPWRNATGNIGKTLWECNHGPLNGS